VLHVTRFEERDRYQNERVEDASPLGPGELVYYLRALEQERPAPGGARLPGHFALSSPIWVSP
jgi:hypothetical protein